MWNSVQCIKIGYNSPQCIKITHISVPCIRIGSGLNDSFSVLWDFFEIFFFDPLLASRTPTAPFCLRSLLSTVPFRADWLWHLRSIFTPLQIVFCVNATWKDTSTKKKRKNRPSCQSLSVAPAASPPYVRTPFRLGSLPLTLSYTVLTYFNVERLILFSKMLVRENKCKSNHCISCTFTLMQTTKQLIFHVCACFLRLQVPFCYLNTRLQRIINSFC